MGRIGTRIRECVNCGAAFETGAYSRANGFVTMVSRCDPCSRKGERGLSPLELQADGVPFRLVASAYPRVLIDAVGALGQWDTAAWDGRSLGGLHYGDMPAAICRAAERALRKAGEAFWPKELREGRIGA